MKEGTWAKSYLFFVVVSSLFLALAMRLINITDGLWIDEIWSMVMSSPDKSVYQIIEACKLDTHPPFFDLLLHFYLKAFGDNPINGRILSLFIGFIGIFATYFYTFKISKNHIVSTLALSLISLNFFHIYYSVEGRFYTFLYLLSLAVLSHIYLYYREQKHVDLVLFTLISIVLVYTHYYGIILLAAIAISILFLWIIKEISRKSFLWSLLSGLLILLSFAPWLPYMFSAKEKDSWMSVPSLASFFEYLYNYTGKNPVEFIFIVTALIASIRLWKANKLLYTLLFGTVFLGFLIPFIVSNISLPMLHYRYTFIYFPSIILMVALFWGETKFFKNKMLIVIFTVVFVSIMVNFFFVNNYTKGVHKEPWRIISEDLAKENLIENKLVFTDVGFYLNYYLKRNNHPNALSVTSTIEAESFWYLMSPYDEHTIKSEDFIEISTKDYGNGFILYNLKSRTAK